MSHTFESMLKLFRIYLFELYEVANILMVWPFQVTIFYDSK